MSLLKIVDEFENIIKSREFRIFHGKKAISIVVKRTKAGRGVDNDQSSRPSIVRLEPVGPRYATWRRRVINKGSFFPAGRKSNLTLTGQMLDATGLRITSTGFEIFIKRNPRRVIRVAPSRGSRRSKKTSISTNQTNADVARHVQDNGRPFWALADREQRILAVEMQDMIVKKLNMIGNIRL